MSLGRFSPSRSFLRFRSAAETEKNLRDAPHLNFLRALRDAIPPMMAIDMLERLVPRIAHAAMHLHRAIGSLANQPIRAVIAHRDFVGETPRDFRLRHLIHLPRGLVDQSADHRGLRLQLYKGPLDRLIGR